MNEESRIDSEWVALNAFRELLKIATKGDGAKSTYNDALEFGGALYPALLGPDSSLLRRVRESDTTTLYRQRANLLTQKTGKSVTALELLKPDLEELEDLLTVASRKERDRSHVDQLKRRVTLLRIAKDELNPTSHSENQLVFRDADVIRRDLPEVSTGRGFRDFSLPDTNILRVRVLHPDRPEHVTGSDVIYERHEPGEQQASIVAIQYKIWEDRSLGLTDPRLQKQIEKLRSFTCEQGLCWDEGHDTQFRFPYCAAFLRPTDRLQRSNQKLLSTGEHLPICKIEPCATKSRSGNPVLRYKNIRKISLSGESFEYLFTAGKIGSRMLSYKELIKLYSRFEVAQVKDHVVIHAQEFPP